MDPSIAKRNRMDLALFAAALGIAIGLPGLTWAQVPTPGGPSGGESFKQEMIAVADGLCLDFPTKPNAIAMAAMIHDQTGNSAQAVTCWQQCLKLDPNHAEAYNAIGMIALRGGEYERAESMWRKALQLRPNMPGVHHRLAHALMGLGRMPEAITALNAAIQIDPKSSRCYYLLGQTYVHLHEYEQAKKNYEKAIQLNPDELEAYYGLATACARLGQTEQAHALREEFAKRNADYWTHHVDQRSRYDDDRALRQALARTCTAAGRVYAQYGQPRKAEKLWLRAASADRKNTQCRLMLSTLYQAMSREEKACQVCEQLTRIEPDNPVHYLNLGSLNVRLGRKGAASSAFRRAKGLAEAAVAKEPSAANYYALCLARDRTGDAAGAVAAIRRAIELAPHNVRYQQILGLLQKGPKETRPE